MCEDEGMWIIDVCHWVSCLLYLMQEIASVKLSSLLTFQVTVERKFDISASVTFPEEYKLCLRILECFFVCRLQDKGNTIAF